MTKMVSLDQANPANGVWMLSRFELHCIKSRNFPQAECVRTVFVE